ncbi:hypothetical protein SRDD_07260 [Serratia sp. DD3]|nr:hypothetical protein SRDD_07260 [Serratia sp. DD3]
MLTITQWVARLKAPVPLVIHRRATDFLIVIIDMDHTARFSLTTDDWRAVVGSFVSKDIALLVTHLIFHLQIGGRCWCLRIDNNIEDTGWVTGDTDTVGHRRCQVMFTLTQCRLWRKAPLTVVVYLGRTEFILTVVNRHRAAWQRSPVQCRGVVIGDIPWLQCHRFWSWPLIIDDRTQHRWCRWDCTDGNTVSR